LLSLSLAQLAAAASSAPIHFEDLGLSPNLFTIGSFSLRWYSLAYLAGILLAYWHTNKAAKTAGAPLAQRHIDDLFFYCTLGVILGGRLGYATFYTGGNTGLPSLWAHPGELIQLWNGGMSFHGGLIGVVLAISWVCWRNKLSILRVADYVAVAACCLAASPISSMASCGAGLPDRTCPGRSSSRARASCRATPASSTRHCSKGCFWR
jgi:phosphatidylglycerol:prolipoprotein diacylglycerol transferase